MDNFGRNIGNPKQVEQVQLLCVGFSSNLLAEDR